MLITVSKIDELPRAAEQALTFAGNCKVFLFSGEMGAGKTTLIKSMCEALGSQDTLSSPTYSLVNEYSSPAGQIFHFDFFRIKTQTEAYDMGFEEYLYSGNYCFIEWPERVSDLWPESFVAVHLDIEADESRIIELKKTPPDLFQA